MAFWVHVLYQPWWENGSTLKKKENLNLIRDQKMLKEDMFLMFCLEEGFMPNLPELDNSLLAHKHDWNLADLTWENSHIFIRL